MLKICKILLLLICICFLGFAYSACSKEENEVKSEEKKSDEPPTKLTDIEENIDKLILSLGGPKEEDKKEEQQENIQKSEEKDGKKEEEKAQEEEKQKKGDENKKEDDSGNDQGEKEEGKQDGEEEQIKEKKKEDDKKIAEKLQIISPEQWNEISKTLEDIHFNWNELVVELQEKVQDKSQLEDFSDSLNTLTDTAKANDQKTALAQANYLYSYIPEFLSLYKGSTKASEVKRMKYYARNSIIMAREPNWTNAILDVDKLLEIFDTYVLISKQSEESKDSKESEGDDSSAKVEQEILMKLKSSYDELEAVVKENNKELVEVKGKIVLTNIDEYQKFLDHQKEKEKEKEKK